jgi:hypothetical protein
VGVIRAHPPVVTCGRQHVEIGSTYLHELVLGDPTEHYRREGLTPAARLEEAITNLLARDERLDDTHAATLARMITATIRISTTATIHLRRSDKAVLADIREQIQATLPPPRHAA